MEMIFNELSIFPLSNNEYEANNKMEKFSNAVAVARKKGFRNIRSYHNINQIDLSEKYSVHNWIHNKNISKNYRDILFGMIIQPFINEDDELVEERYINANYYFEDEENGIKKQECVGLASAYLYETLSISLSSSKIWDKHLIPIVIETENSRTIDSVLNISSKEVLDVEEIKTFIENSGDVILIKTDLLPKEKKIHLASHHGQSELQSLCDKLKLSDYVIEMRSTNWGGKNFIRETYSNGVIEIVLVNSQREYALWVQTTGKNLRETRAISEILRKKYS
ncbi:hypothetical protein [Flavobacterium muglaense]|uniref:Uncharacterized protein n=1 Tax=Flavobacterium muglaense TaxID=2764716 RepID=A0A923SEC0_9FLAO|nr:hypothetical protein [Flavobacterium muglaense]MBC5836694.1 hypothetical protein [Flavobacterium muglaense]MBC5843356.1 hypothetical protein [Flavobacterium muglaense]